MVMLPGAGADADGDDIAPPSWSIALLPPRYGAGCDGMPMADIGIGIAVVVVVVVVWALATPTDPMTAAPASKSFRIYPSSITLDNPAVLPGPAPSPHWNASPFPATRHPPNAGPPDLNGL